MQNQEKELDPNEVFAPKVYTVEQKLFVSKRVQDEVDFTFVITMTIDELRGYQKDTFIESENLINKAGEETKL